MAKPRKVKCVLTGEQGMSDQYVKVGGKYYKSQEVYDEERRKIDGRKAIVERIHTEFLGYQEGGVFSTLIPKKLNELSAYDPDVIMATLDHVKDSMLHMFNMDGKFNDDQGKINYLFGTVRNHINQMNRRWKEKQKLLALESVRDRSAHHEMEDADVLCDANKTRTKKAKDISHLL